MPSRHSVVAVASVAALALVTGCEKQNPYVTLTAGGVVVKAQALEYCRGDDCRVTDHVPTLKVKPGDTLGIDVPRSLAEQGWSTNLRGAEEVRHDHYWSVTLQGALSGELVITRNPDHGKGVWRFKLVAEE